jgi:prolipoprotein diacylglyceryltransferase
MTIDDIRDAYKVRDGYWFAPKLFGFGAVPATWQGWAVILAFVAALMAAMRWLPTPAEKLIVGFALLAALVAVTAARTDGGLHWRWGRK